MNEIKQPTFTHHAYGVDVEWFGDEGGMAAHGHIPDLRFLAAANHLARSIGLRNVWDDPCILLDDVRAAIERLWVVPIAPYDPDCEWMVTWKDVTEQTPGAIPLTVLDLS